MTTILGPAFRAVSLTNSFSTARATRICWDNLNKAKIMKVQITKINKMIIMIIMWSSNGSYHK